MTSEAGENGRDRTESFAVLSEGTIVGHYKIIEKIGAGGMGEVYLAEDTRLDRRVALKFLPPHLCQDEDCRKRFKREAQAAAKLDHPNIIHVYEVSEHQGRPYIVMQYVEGKSLRDIIKEKELPLDQIIDLAIQICEGLSKAHEAGVIHRDIKPSNICIGSDGRPKILDFGLAAVQGSEHLTKTGSTLGTIGYMSPEQVKGEKVNHCSDIFSMGIVLYEMITGQTPFKGESEAAIIYSIVNEEPEPLAKYKSDIPEELQQVVDKALAKDIDERYQTIDDLMEDLRLVKSGQEVLHAPPAVAAKRRPKVKSLAVLYLKNLGAADDEYLSYGITEDLIVDLTRIGTMRVAPMRSILKYRDSDDEIEDIAKKLDVSIILDGSIHRSEKAVRVSAQLVDINTRKNLWANRWEEPPDNLPQVKQFLAQGISQALELESSVVKAAQVGKPEAQNPQAYEYYLRGKYTFEHKKDTADVEVALGLYRQALTLEPSLLAARAGVAEILIHKRELEQSNQWLTSALTDARGRFLRVDEASILLLLAKCQTVQCRWDEAKEYVNQALFIRKELHDLAGEAEALGVLISILQPRAKFEEALPLFERVLEINRQLDDQHKEAEALRTMAMLHGRKGENIRARLLFNEAKTIARRRNNASLEAKCINGIGTTYFQTGDLDKALRYYYQALQILTLLGDEAGKAPLYNNIALIHDSRGAYKEAIEFLKKAASIHKDYRNRADYALFRNNISKLLTTIGEYEQAIIISREALAIARDLEYPLIIADANKTLGFAYFCKGEYGQAKEYYHAALEIAEQACLQQYVAATHSDLGRLHYYLKNYDLSRKHLEKALTIADEIKDKSIQLTVSAFLAALTVIEGQFDAGVNRLREIFDEAKDYGDPEYVLIAQRLLGQALLEHGPSDSDRKEGRAILEDALALAKEKEIAPEIKWIGEILERNRMNR